MEALNILKILFRDFKSGDNTISLNLFHIESVEHPDEEHMKITCVSGRTYIVDKIKKEVEESERPDEGENS